VAAAVHGRAFTFFYVLISLCFWVTVYFTIPSSEARASFRTPNEVGRIQTGILAVAAGFYAMYRVTRFHPACNPGYSAWLRLSPWTAAKPLPLGPVHPVWQDAVVLGLLSVVSAWHAHLSAWLPVIVFGLTYLATLTILLLFTRQWPACVALGFLWPALILPGLNLTEGIGLFAVIAAVIWYGHGKSLRAFPWEFLNRPGRQANSILQIEISAGTAAGAPATLGWPFTAIAPKFRAASVSTQSSFWLSALFGWWSYCLIKAFDLESVSEAIIAFAAVAGCLRLVIYHASVLSSSSLWSRIFSGNLIVPGFDKMFLAPLAAVLISVAGGILIRRAGPYYACAESLVIALIWFVLFSGGPTRRNWILTGHHRFRQPARRNAQRQQIREV
jgi:hypothetical protein